MRKGYAQIVPGYGVPPEFTEGKDETKAIHYRHAQAFEDQLKGPRFVCKLSDDDHSDDQGMAYIGVRSF